MPACAAPGGTCIRSSQSSCQRHSSSSSASVRAHHAERAARRRISSTVASSCHTGIAPLVTYLPKSPASYQPPETSNRPGHDQPGYSRSASGPVHASTLVSPAWPAGRPYPGARASSIGIPERWR